MKANETPTRIYVDNPNHDFWYRTKNENNIEYTRTDAFIERACKWFRRIDYDDSIPPFETTEEFIEGFKNAMAL